MRKKALWGVAILAGLYALRFSLKTSEELRRYNHILSLSNEGPVSQEIPDLMAEVLKQQRQTLAEWMNFVQSAPRDLMRYLKIGTM